MKFIIIPSLLVLFSALVSSTPVARADTSPVLEARAVATTYPSLVVNICSPDNGYPSHFVSVSRYTSGGTQYDCSSLLSYTFSQGYPGKMCTFDFTGAQYAGGTRKLQLFSVGGVITPSNTFKDRPHRNVPHGIFTISADATTATWDNTPTPTFACPATATTLGYELAPQGDDVWAGWDMSAGLAIVVL